MAGYTSTPRQYGEYIQPYNIDLIAKALTYKQNKYDAADAQIRQQINQIGSMDLLKSEDKGYLLSRLSSMLGDINNVGALDLSDSGIVRNLDNHISQSIDDKVLNAYQSTKQIRAFQQSIQELQKKNPELYNVANVAFAMQPVDAYMRSGKVGENISDYGSLTYTPYVDIQGEVNKQMETYVKNMKDGIIKMPNPDDPRMIIEVDTNGMNDNQIRQLVGSMISSKYQDQARINAWQRYGRYSPEGMASYKNDVNSYIGYKKEEYDGEIVRLETELNSIKDKGQNTSDLRTKVENLKSEKGKLDDFGLQMLQNPNAYGGILEKEGLVGNIARLYKPFLMPTPNSYAGVNEGYYKEKELEYKQITYNLEVEKHNLQVQKLELDRDKNRREEEEFRLKASGQWRGGGSDSGSGSKSGADSEKFDGISVGTMEVAPPNKDWVAEKNNILTQKNQEVQDKTKSAFEYVTRLANSNGEMSEQAKTILKDYDLQRKGKHNGHLFRQILFSKGKNLGLNFIEDAQGRQIFNISELSSAVDEFIDLNKRFEDIKKQNVNVGSVMDTEDYVKQIQSEDIVIATPKGNSKLTTYLRDNGYIKDGKWTGKKLSENAFLRNTMVANVLLGEVLSTKTKTESSGYGGLGTSSAYVVAGFTDSDIKQLSQIYKEDLSFLKNMKVDEIKNSNFQSKAPNFYNALKNYQRINSRTFYDTRMGKDSTLSNITERRILENNKTAREKYNQDIMMTLQGVGVDNAITMTNPKDVNFQKFAAQITSFGRGVDGGISTETLRQSILPTQIGQITYRVRSANDEIEVRFKVDGGKDGVKEHSAKLSISDLKRNAPDFMNNLDFQEQNFYYSQKGMGNKKIATSSDGISFVSPTAGFIYSSKVQQNLQKEYGQLPFYDAVVTGVHKDSSKRYLKELFKFGDSNKVWYGNIINNNLLTPEEKNKALQQQQQIYFDAVDRMVDNSSNYVLDASFINEGSYALQLKDKQGRTVAGKVQYGDNLKPIKSLFDNYESSAYNMFLASIIEDERSNMAYNTTGFTEQFKKLTGLQ